MKKLSITILFSLLLSFSWAQNGVVKGKVSDANNNDPIPFANVIVEGTQIGSTTDLDGNFIITGLQPGYINLRVSYVGYQTKISSDVLINNNSVPFINIALKPRENELEEVVVKVNFLEKKEEAPLSMQSIGTKEIESNPGSNRDISRVIQSFPGVGSTPAFRNDVIIRGGGPSENRFFLDGVEIPVLNHFSTQGASGGPVGIINADFIRTVDFYSGSFPADKYNALSGVLDFKLKDGSKDKTNFQLSLGASEAAFTVDGPIGNKTNYIFSVRRSYLQFLFSAIGLPFLPTFNDYQFKVKTDFDKKNQLTIISLGSLDQLKLNTGIENPDPNQEYILTQIPINNQWSYTIGGVYKHFFDNGFHTFVLSRNMLDNQFYKYPDNDESKAKTFDYNSQEIENKMRYEFDYRKNGFKYTVSANVEYAKYNNQTTQQLFVEDSLFYLNYQTDLNLYKYGLSAQASKTVFNERLLLSLGIRMDGNDYNSKTSNPLNQLSPRFALGYSITDQLKLNAGIGRYFQQAAYTTMGFRDNQGALVNKERLQYIGANHYNLGLEYRFTAPMIFSIEGFYKDYFQYPIDLVTGASLANQGAEYSSVYGAVPATFTGTGEAIGFEVLQRVNFTDFSLLATYTYVRSKFTDINNKLIPSSWDSKHLLTITGSKSFKKNWRAGFKWRFVGGLPYTPYDLEKSANIEAWNANGQPYFNYSQLNSERFASFHQLDIRVDKNFFFDKWSLMLYVDIQNLYNFKSEGQDNIIRARNEDGSFQTTNNGKDYVLESITNTSGTVLPTVGIMVKF
jgi:outer membrane receptor for ferrienterochelin and colicin